MHRKVSCASFARDTGAKATKGGVRSMSSDGRYRSSDRVTPDWSSRWSSRETKCKRELPGPKSALYEKMSRIARGTNSLRRIGYNSPGSMGMRSALIFRHSHSDESPSRTPSADRNISNDSRGRGFMNISATMSCVEQNLRLTSLFATRSRMKWCQMSMCFARE
jgi:hypothetical protein